MKTGKVVSILIAGIVLSAAAAFAGPPVDGSWSSTLGQFDEGTAASLWTSPLGYAGPGQTLYGRSYAGGSFTNDWEITCPTTVSVVPLNGALGSSGNGNYTYLLTYTGGFLKLGGPGNPWDGGDAVYTGLIDTYTEVRTIMWANGAVVGAVSDHAIGASIQGYTQSCVSWAIGNGVLRGGSSLVPYPFDYGVLQSVKPANYPDFHDNNCQVVAALLGHWEDIKDLTLTIHGCTVGTEQSSWGSVKAMYRK